jgi:hypothetical protein
MNRERMREKRNEKVRRGFKRRSKTRNLDAILNASTNAYTNTNTNTNTNTDNKARLHPSSNRSLRRRRRQTHLLLPAIHGLLELLLVLEQQHINDLEVVDGAVPLKVLADLEADPGGGDVEGVEGDDLGGL